MGREKQNANLIPATKPGGHQLTREEQSMGGKASGKKRAEKKQRGEIWREIMNTEIINKKMLENIRSLGIVKENPTLEDYIKAVATRDLINNAKIADVQRIDDEIYGPIVQKMEQTLISPKPLVDLSERKKNGE